MISHLIKDILRQAHPDWNVQALHGKENSQGKVLVVRTSTNGHDSVVDQDKQDFRAANIQIGIHGHLVTESYTVAEAIIDTLTSAQGDYTSLVEGYHIRSVEYLSGPQYIKQGHWTVSFYVRYRST